MDFWILVRLYTQLPNDLIDHSLTTPDCRQGNFWVHAICHISDTDIYYHRSFGAIFLAERNFYNYFAFLSGRVSFGVVGGPDWSHLMSIFYLWVVGITTLMTKSTCDNCSVTSYFTQYIYAKVCTCQLLHGLLRSL